RFGGDPIGGQTKVTLVFPILVVDEDHHLARANVVERRLHPLEGFGGDVECGGRARRRFRHRFPLPGNAPAGASATAASPISPGRSARRRRTALTPSSPPCNARRPCAAGPRAPFTPWSGARRWATPRERSQQVLGVNTVIVAVQRAPPARQRTASGRRHSVAQARRWQSSW